VTEKENFLMLASHYLRTPLTIIKGNIELMQSLKQIADETANKLQLSVAVVMEEANGLLARLESNQGLARITKPQDAGQVRMKSLMSPLVIGPIILVFGLMTISHFLFIDFRVTNPNLIDFLVQVGLGILLAQLFISKFRAHQINIKNRQDQERLLEEQRELDKARNDLISNAGQRLSGQVARFGTELEALGKSGIDTAKIRKGYDQLKVITNKFVFATQLEADTLKLGKQQFNSDELINIVISHKQPAAEAKHVTINAEPGNLMLIENQGMLNIVLDSLIDNAVKYSEQQGQVNVRAVAEPEAFRFVVEDHGKGLSERQLSGLFKPFSRAESAETFDTEGLGFSLYLDKLIMHYLGGDIAITSVPGQGTQAQVLLPVL
jgi:signal transduction histidine kinase